MKIISTDIKWNEITVKFSGSDRMLMRFMRDFLKETVRKAYKCNSDDILIKDTDISMYKKSIYELAELLAAIEE